MIIAHAIIVSGGLTALLIAAAALVIAGLVIMLPRVIPHRHHIADPLGVPVWWDETPAPRQTAASDQSDI